MKHTKYKFNAWIVTCVVVIAVILINLIVSALASKVNLKIDLTKGGQFQITQETKTALKQLTEPVSIFVIGTEEQASSATKEYLERYRNLSSNLIIRYIDVYQNQDFLTKYQQKGESLSQGDLLLECGNNYKLVKASQLYSQSFSFEEGQDNYNYELETRLTNALVTVSGLMEESTVYFLEGHGEQKSTLFAEAITAQGHKKESVSIVNASIPSDAKLLITFMPAMDFGADELDKIDRFLENGGNFLAVYAPGSAQTPALDSYLKEWGITPQHAMILEKDKNMAGQSEIMFYPTLNEHEITQTLIDRKMPLVFFGSIGFETANSNVQRANVTALALSSEQAIGKVNTQSSNTAFEEGDLNGPFTLAAVAERSYDKPARVAAIGSAYALELPAQMTGTNANSEFSANLLSYLTQNAQNLKIPPKMVTQGKITKLTENGVQVMYYTLVILIPLLILVAGIIIWLKRRYL